MTTGNAFCGSIGSHVRAEYAVVGDVINLAARLMSAASAGEILCDEKTQEETSASIEYQDAREMAVKGKASLVRVFAVRIQQTETSLEANALLDAMHALPYGCETIAENVPLFGSSSLRSARRGVGKAHRVLIVAGDTGTGKTMLLRHFLNHHTRCFMGTGDPVDSTSEFHAWAGIIRKMATRTVKMAKSALADQSVVSESVLPKPIIAHLSSLSSEMTRSIKDQIDSAVGADDERSQASSRNTTPSSSYSDDGSAKAVDLSRIAVNRSFGEASTSHSDRSAAPLTSRPPQGTLRLLGSLASTVERVPVLEYLVHKGWVSRSMIPVLNDLLPYDQLCHGSFSAFDKGEERSKALEHLIFSIVEGLSAHKPILLLFDNAQWMDGLSCSLLLKVLEELPNVSCVLATRLQSRTVSHSLFALVEQLPDTKRLEMPRFSYQVSSLFLCQHYHIAIMDTQVLDFVYARTDGNPAELLKLMAFMLASKCISVDRAAGSIAILADLDDLDMQVPQYTRARVMSCIDSLDGLAQLAIKVVSVNPEPAEERTVVRILALFLASERDDSRHDVGGFRLKAPLSDSALSLQTQVRIGLAECEREAILTIDDRKKVLFFNSEEMRLVVYDTMLPSQRETIHAYYSQWLRDVTADERRDDAQQLSTQRLPAIASGSSVVSGTESAALAVGSRYQQLAMLGYHLSRSCDPKAALEAYLRAAEHAIDAHELAFATDCMQSSSKLLSDHQPRHTKKLNDLDTIVLRSRVEFMRGAIAVEKSEWDSATTHMASIVRLCQRKGSVLRRYSSSIHHDSLFDSTKTKTRLKSKTKKTTKTPSSICSLLPSTSGLLRLHSTDSLWFLAMQERCLPPVTHLRLLTSRLVSSTARLFEKAIRRRPSGGPVWLMGAGRSRVQPEQETLLALHQVNFYQRQAELLITKIQHAKRKQEEMRRAIQQLTQRSLQTKPKR